MDAETKASLANAIVGHVAAPALRIGVFANAGLQQDDMNAGLQQDDLNAYLQQGVVNSLGNVPAATVDAAVTTNIANAIVAAVPARRATGVTIGFFGFHE